MVSRVPTSVLTARFTKVGEAVYCGNLKGLLSPTEEDAIDLLEAQMRPHQVEQFRLVILNMVNRSIPTNKEVPELNLSGEETGQKKIMTEMVAPAFTENDSRVKRLRSYSRRIMVAEAPEEKIAVAKTILAKLLQEGSITAQPISDIVRKGLGRGTQSVLDGWSVSRRCLYPTRNSL